jgi:glucokinase
MADCILAVDAGGTSLKSALMSPDGLLIADTHRQTPIKSANPNATLSAFSECAVEARKLADIYGTRISRVGVCCPGPFDFERGISLMKHKWQDAYGKPIAPSIESAIGAPVVFLHDSSAFILGEYTFGAGRGADRLLGVMLGTGFGFGWMNGGRVQIQKNRSPALVLWNRAFRDGITEDYVSRRAILERYKTITGSSEEIDVHDIAMRARGGDSSAIETFAATGALLGEILNPVARELECGRLVIGGQISRAADLILPYANIDIETRIAEHISDAAQFGLAAYCTRGHSDTMEEKQ